MSWTACVEKHRQDPTVPIHYITQDRDICHYCEPSYNPGAVKVRHERGKKIKRELNHGGYIKAHPTKQAIVGGKWVTIKR